MSERGYLTKVDLSGKTTAKVGEPNEQGWATVLGTGYLYGEPVVIGQEVRLEDVRCPKCNKKLGDKLLGTYETTCPRCKERVTITR